MSQPLDKLRRSILVRAAGNNNYGQCCTDPAVRIPLTLLSPGSRLETAVRIALGCEFTAVLTPQGEVFTAGRNYHGQLGQGAADKDPHPELRTVPLPCPAVDIACGLAHLLVCLSDGRVVACGDNFDSQCGLADHEVVPVPVLVPTVADAVRVFAGWLFSFVLCRGGDVFCFGCNDAGGLAQGSVSKKELPQRAAALSGIGVREITAGWVHGLALLEDGGVLGWGRLRDRLLDGSTWTAERGGVPIRLRFGGEMLRAVSASAGEDSCAVATEDGKLWCWGNLDFVAYNAEPRALALPGGRRAVRVQCDGVNIFASAADGQVYSYHPYVAPVDTDYDCTGWTEEDDTDGDGTDEQDTHQDTDEDTEPFATPLPIPGTYTIRPCTVATGSVAHHVFLLCAATSQEYLHAAAGLPDLRFVEPEAPIAPLDGATAASAGLTAWTSSAANDAQAALVAAIDALKLAEEDGREKVAFSQLAAFYAIREQLHVWECERRSIVYRHREQVAHTSRSTSAALHRVWREMELDMEEKIRRFALFLEQRFRVQLQHAAGCSQLCIAAEASAARIQEAQDALRKELSAALRAAALARTVRITIDYPDAPGLADAPPKGAYLRAFADCDGGPQWEHVQGGAAVAVLQCPDVTQARYRIAQGSKDPVEAAVCSGSLRCGAGGKEQLLLPSGFCVTLDADAEGCPPALPGFCSELLDEAKKLPRLAAPLGPVGDLHRARDEALRLHAAFREMQQCAQSLPADDGERAKRDAARVEARDARKKLLDALGASEVAMACGENRQRELEDLARRLAASAPPEEREGDDVSPMQPAAALAGESAEQALKSLAVWQEGYNKAVQAAEQDTDAALAASRKFDEDGARPLGELLSAVRSAAAEEARVRAQPEGVTAPPREVFNKAVYAALDAIEAVLGAIVAVRAEREEMELVLAELTEGCGHAASGFYARVDRFAGCNEPDSPGADAAQEYEDAKQDLVTLKRLQAKGRKVSPEDIAEAEREVIRTKARAEGSFRTVQALQKQADLMRVEIGHAVNPESRRELERQRDDILQRLRVMRSERAEEGAELLRIVKRHFPECIEQLRQGINESFVGQVPLRLLLGGGTPDDYPPISGERGVPLSHRHRVYRAEGCEGEVVLKQVLLADSAALSSFTRSVRMAAAAGDVAARMRRVFIHMGESGDFGCIVMDSYPHTLTSWAAQCAADGSNHIGALRMVQLLLERMVRLHSPVADFPDGVVHGDITPANIVVDAAGVPRFIDFEMARAASGATTGTVHVLGMTPDYAAPEIRVGGFGMRDPAKKTTKATDIYGMGVTLKELVKDATGPGKDQLLQLCDRMTNRDPSQRPTAVEALAASEITAAVRDEVDAERDKLRKEFHLAPAHWTGTLDPGQAWQVVPVPEGSDIFACLRASIARGFELRRAWRIEHPTRWREFCLKREGIRSDIASGRLPKDTPALAVRRELAETLGPLRSALPEPLHDSGGVNERRLFHGTRPESLLAIISGGMNERLCGKNGTRFGDGTYFAEEAAKSNGYCTPHRSNSLPDLEGRFYRDGVSHPGGDVYYMFVCRVVCGCFVTTKNGTKSVPGDHYIFATSNRRELAFPPEVGPTGARYTSILADPGGHREFIVFNGQQVYTEYVLACHRK